MILGIFGPMYSGKSSLLKQKMERYLYAHKKVVLIRPKIDNRGYFCHNNEQDKIFEKFSISVLYENEITDTLIEELKSFDLVCVDEFFMIKNNVKLIYLNSDIVFSGLLASSECKLFDECISILPYCDEIVKINAVCEKCGADANYSYYKGKNKTTDILIGDTEYIPLCKSCYLKSKNNY